MTAGFKSSFNTTGIIRIYSGSPPGPNAVPTGTLLSTIGINTTAFATPGATTRLLTANALTSDTSAAATGTAGYFRVKLSGDADTAVATFFRMEGTVGTSGADMNLNSTAITIGGTVTITSWTYTHPA